MSRLILIRHSQSQPDPHTPPSQWALTAEGRRLCQPLAEQLRPYQPHHFLTSPEPKALQTAQLTAQQLRIPWSVEAGVAEQGGGHVPYLETADQFRAAVRRLFEQPHAAVLGHETAAQAQRRFVAALPPPDGRTVAIVTHGRVLSLALAQLLGLDPWPFWQALTMPCFVVLYHEDGQWQPPQPIIHHLSQ